MMDEDHVKLIDLLIKLIKDGVARGANIDIKHRGSNYKATCCSSQCSFEVRFRLNTQRVAYVLSTVNHSCTTKQPEIKIPALFFREYVSQKMSELESLTTSQIIDLIASDLRIPKEQVNKVQVYSSIRGFRKKELSGNQSHALLEDFAEKYNMSNNATMRVIKDDNNVLQYVYIDFPHSKLYSMMENRLYLLDGTHQKISYKSTMLVLAGTTGFKTVIPLAVMWALDESRASTEAFFKNAKGILGNNPVFKSDAAQSFISVINEKGYRHSLCIHHLMAKLKSKAISIIRDMKHAQTQSEFNTLTEELKKESPAAWKKIQNRMSLYFRLSGEPPTFCNDGSGAIESLNNLLMQARNQSFTLMIKETLTCVNKQMMNFKATATNQIGNKLTSVAMEKIQKRIARGRREFRVKSCNGSTYTIVSKLYSDSSMSVFTVSNNNGVFCCSCGEALHTGLPCVHICTVIHGEELLKTVSSYWFVNTYNWIYETKEAIIPLLEILTATDLHLPQTKNLPGRPKTKRYLSIAEYERTVKRMAKAKPHMKQIKQHIDDVEESLLELYHSMDDDTLDTGAFCFILIDKIKEVDSILTELIGIQKQISNRAAKSITIYQDLQNEIMEICDMIVSTFTEFKAKALPALLSELHKMSTLSRIKWKNSLNDLTSSIEIYEFRSIIGEMIKYIE